MTWRERIAAARQRGGFTQEDRRLAEVSYDHCAVGEVCRALGVDLATFRASLLYEIPFMGYDHPAAGLFPTLLKTDTIDRVEWCLDEIEDRVLRVKRGEA